LQQEGDLSLLLLKQLSLKSFGIVIMHMGRFKHHSLGIANSKALGWVTIKDILFSLAEQLLGYGVVLFHEIKKQEVLEEEKRQQNKRF